MSKRIWPTSTVVFVAGILAVAIPLGATVSRAGEPAVVPAAPAQSPGNGALVNVRVLDPGLLPAATELEDRLLYHLRHLPHLLWPVLAGPATGETVRVGFVVDVQLEPVPVFPVRVLSAKPPFLRTEPARAVFAGQVPLQARVTVSEANNNHRVVAQAVLVAQSTGFTITAGTTKPAADLMAEKIVHYLKTQRRQGGFLRSRVATR